jgi:hypothetical protein
MQYYKFKELKMSMLINSLSLVIKNYDSSWQNT